MPSIAPRSRRLSILAIAVLSVAGAACSSEDIAERAVNQAIEMDGGDGRISLDDNSITMTDGEATVSMGAGDLPEGYPPNLPVFDPAAEPLIAMAFNDEEQGQQRMTASYTFDAPASEVAEWYEAALAAAGFEVTEPYSGGTSAISFEGEGWTGGIAIIDQGVQTSANIHLERPLN